MKKPFINEFLIDLHKKFLQTTIPEKISTSEAIKDPENNRLLFTFMTKMTSNIISLCQLRWIAVIMDMLQRLGHTKLSSRYIDMYIVVDKNLKGYILNGNYLAGLSLESYAVSIVQLLGLNIKPVNTLCRKAADECDFEEFCNGNQSVCVPDTYARDGELCESGDAYCYKGRCRSVNRHQSMCGKLVCAWPYKTLVSRTNLSVIYTHVRDEICASGFLNAEKLPRDTFTTVQAPEDRDETFVEDGSICGPEMICIGRKQHGQQVPPQRQPDTNVPQASKAFHLFPWFTLYTANRTAT
ncbi:hypothetical protein Celaphus_00019357, partial [Cervus elaphus hippelaphus]